MTMRPMKGAELRSILKRWNVSQATLAKFLGFLPRQLRRIIAGDAKMPDAPARLLRLMDQQELDMPRVEKATDPGGICPVTAKQFERLRREKGPST